MQQKSLWIFGIVAGLFCATLEYLFFSTTGSSANTMFLTKIAILSVCVGAGLILLRKLSGGIISIARTVFSGLLISFIRAIVMIVAFILLYQPNGDFYQPRVEEAFIQAEKKVSADENIKDADKSMELDQIKIQIASLYKVPVYTLSTIGSSLVTGLIVSILMAAFIGTNMMYNETKQ
ncbi:MAG: hypothetical protein ACJA19_000274 [Bacteroidia bacterium]|jgi:hypothetical protein|tara:strand:- start:7573 stop:8106 length:534 start_codon:yes stop_codon:yes gene_type:complete